MEKSSKDRLLYFLKSKGPQTAGELGNALGMTTPGAQQHLAKLEGMGLIEAEDRIHGKGRPRRFWHLTEKGHARFPERHSDLTLDLLESTKAVFGADGLEKLIAYREREACTTYEEELGALRTLKEKVVVLAAIRTREGYMAEWQETRAGQFLLIENHCPICAAAKACQGLCRSELVVFRAVLGPSVIVERRDHILAGARRCAYEITQR